MAELSSAEFGLASYTEMGVRTYGHPFALMVNEAVILMERMTSGKRDPASGQPLPKRDSRDVLPQIVWEVLREARGFGVEINPVPLMGMSRELMPLGKYVGPREQLVDVLYDLLDDVSLARWTGQDLAIDRRMTLSHKALERTLDRIQAVFDQDLPSPLVKHDARRAALAERVRWLEGQLGIDGKQPYQEAIPAAATG